MGLAAAIALGWLVFRPAPGKADAVSDEPASNPHWKTDGCASCHAMAGGKPGPIAAAEVEHLCLKCHDGTHASSEVHPVGRKVDLDHLSPASGWPVVQGRLSCLTCHDVRSACKVTPNMTPNDPMFLRGHEKVDPTGPGPQVFCLNCHKADAGQKFNPHLMLDSKKQIIENRCLFCHEKVPDRNAMARTGSATLRLAQISLCKSCHPHHKEILKGGHLEVKVNPDFAAYMRAREIIGLIGEPSEALIAQLKMQNAKPTHMYLEPDGGVTCATCHNPHPQGLFPVGSPLYYRTMHVMGGHPISPVHEQNFCRNCHRL